MKFVPHAFATDPSAFDRFMHEARAESALNHPRICTIYDSDDHQCRPYRRNAGRSGWERCYEPYAWRLIFRKARWRSG
jgi:hypothetical protein